MIQTRLQNTDLRLMGSFFVELFVCALYPAVANIGVRGAANIHSGKLGAGDNRQGNISHRDAHVGQTEESDSKTNENR